MVEPLIEVYYKNQEIKEQYLTEDTHWMITFDKGINKYVLWKNKKIESKSGDVLKLKEVFTEKTEERKNEESQI